MQRSTTSAVTPAISDFIAQQFQPQNGEANHRQLCRLLQQGILNGTLPGGTKLPPTRELAQELGIARNTVVHVYEQLASEGYVSTMVGRGTFITDTVPDQGGDYQNLPLRPPSRQDLLSGRGADLVNYAGAAKQQWGAFVPGVPDVTLFPFRTWVNIGKQVWRKPAADLLTYPTSAGYLPLRQAIADYLRAARGVNCSAEQVLITTGTHQSLRLAAHMLAEPGERVWLEDPGYWGARSLLRSEGLELIGVEVDAEGMHPSPYQMQRLVPRLIVVSPSHQYPLGSVMSLTRRRQLLQYAQATDAWVLEDDYDSEFRFGCKPLQSLQGLDASGRVLYLGTLSKTMYPGLRISYMVVPPDLVDSLTTGLIELYREGAYTTQAILAEFIAQGHFASHIRRMRTVYSRRRALLIDAIRAQFGDTLPVLGDNAGLHLVISLPDGCDDQAISAHALHHGVLARPLSLYYHDLQHAKRGLLLGYACVPEGDIARHFATVANAIRAYL
jgi:GntR family transcriptional regulator/MocR family aminotransferase